MAESDGMSATAQDEEHDRIQKAHDNVAAWQKKYIGDAGFSGGVRMVVETQDGIIASSERRFGDPRASRIIAAPLDKPAVPSQVVRRTPEQKPVPNPVHITQPESWFRRFINYLWKGKSS